MSVDPGSPAPAQEEAPPRPVFDNVEEWVLERFLPMYRRTLGGEFRWCAQWWLHSEAVSRLTALWRSWEALRLEPATGIADWYHYLDSQLPILLGARGPFYQCSEDQHIEPHQAGAEPAPPGYWDVASPPPEADQGPDATAEG
ncbi:DUF4913 domain-containing protein [Thermomonospora umbrina]|uniref:Uncharacterized protein DUF4913 n=1 Tax=Thermomonospora umbrina TaxID=111806 RepID=A0A3D9TA42_9ACTN|nr:DUF4913 domain-containing protein [Thermomonospora umbrina]REF00642.1 uncharacterized protein DUF4913 [Thermomonospora umbrina]